MSKALVQVFRIVIFIIIPRFINHVYATGNWDNITYHFSDSSCRSRQQLIYHKLRFVSLPRLISFNGQNV